ncbi:DMT family transporter [Ruegeria sp.]|uniref:DMT family transporter n=1 Tax=Ruegeria sp. TaxID=1879320 RepID=UPI003B59DEEF
MTYQSSITHGFGLRSQRLDALPGFVAMGVTVLIWASFALSARATNGSALGFADVGVIRALVPMIVFLPFLPSRIDMIRKAGLPHCATIGIGAGIPFFALAVNGGSLTSAAHVGALIPGIMPVFVALILWRLTGAKPGLRGLSALAGIIAGAVLLAMDQSEVSDWRGIGLLLCGSLFWASYSVAAARSGLDPVGCALVISLSSCLVMVLLLASGTVTLQFGSYSPKEALPFVLTQGLGAGVVASLTFAFAVTRIGPTTCATIGALTPVLTALLAVPVLHETLPPMTLLAVVVICVGVILFNRQ